MVTLSMPWGVSMSSETIRKILTEAKSDYVLSSFVLHSASDMSLGKAAKLLRYKAKASSINTVIGRPVNSLTKYSSRILLEYILG
jgi:hypothetical protein